MQYEGGCLNQKDLFFVIYYRSSSVSNGFCGIGSSQEKQINSGSARNCGTGSSREKKCNSKSNGTGGTGSSREKKCNSESARNCGKSNGTGRTGSSREKKQMPRSKANLKQQCIVIDTTGLFFLFSAFLQHFYSCFHKA